MLTPRASEGRVESLPDYQLIPLVDLHSLGCPTATQERVHLVSIFLVYYFPPQFHFTQQLL